MSDWREQKVRERAYAIWEAEDRPDGQDLEHWLRAEGEIAAEEQAADERAELEAGDSIAKAKEAKAKTPSDRRHEQRPARRG